MNISARLLHSWYQVDMYCWSSDLFEDICRSMLYATKKIYICIYFYTFILGI